MSLFGTLIKQGAKFADGLLDDVAIQAKQVDAPVEFDEAAWIAENPKPFPDIRPKDMSKEQKRQHDVWKTAKTRAKNADRYREADRVAAAARRGSRTPEEQEQYLEYQRGYRRRNADTLKDKDKARKSTPEAAAARRKRREADIERYRAAQRERYRQNPALWIEAASNRKRGLKERTPEWRSQDRINEIYRISQELSELTGTPYEVDHVIPLSGRNANGQTVSGLHHQDNLLILPRSDNRKKWAGFEPGDQPPKAGIRNARALLKKLRAEYGVTE